MLDSSKYKEQVLNMKGKYSNDTQLKKEENANAYFVKVLMMKKGDQDEVQENFKTIYLQELEYYVVIFDMSLGSFSLFKFSLFKISSWDKVLEKLD